MVSNLKPCQLWLEIMCEEHFEIILVKLLYLVDIMCTTVLILWEISSQHMTHVTHSWSGNRNVIDYLISSSTEYKIYHLILNLIMNLFFVIIVKIYFYCRYNVFWIHFVCIFLCYNMYRIKEDTFNPHYDLWQLFVKFSVIYIFFVAPLVLMIRKIKLVWK